MRSFVGLTSHLFLTRINHSPSQLMRVLAKADDNLVFLLPSDHQNFQSEQTPYSPIETLNPAFSSNLKIHFLPDNRDHEEEAIPIAGVSFCVNLNISVAYRRAPSKAPGNRQAVPICTGTQSQLLFYGNNFKPLDAEFKTKENKVQGCVSQVWVRAYLDDERNVLFDADSDSVLMKGLAVLLVQGLSGKPVEEIVRVSPDFVVLLGLNQSLTPYRNNGFFNMLKLIQKKAIELYVMAEKGIESAQSSNLDELSSEAGNV
ncbi:SufE-like protein 1, chloroplastic/mitochondrial [Linum perenne]